MFQWLRKLFVSTPAPIVRSVTEEYEEDLRRERATYKPTPVLRQPPRYRTANVAPPRFANTAPRYAETREIRQDGPPSLYDPSNLLNPLNPLSPFNTMQVSPPSSYEPAPSCGSSSGYDSGSSSSYDSGSSSSYDSGSCGGDSGGGGASGSFD